MEDKKALRKKYKTIRDSVGEDDRASFSQRICESCSALSEYRRAKAVLLYFARGSEADLAALAKKALAEGKLVAYPRVEGAGLMVFRTVKKLSELSEGYYGIREPSANAPLCPLNEAICFVPALAFDENGFRLGYGGGFYDRFLADFKGCSVGIAFDATLSECLVCEAHDKKTNYIITESKVKKTIED